MAPRKSFPEYPVILLFAPLIGGNCVTESFFEQPEKEIIVAHENRDNTNTLLKFINYISSINEK